MTGRDVARQLGRVEELEASLRRRRRAAAAGGLVAVLALAPAALAWLPAAWWSAPGSPLPLATWVVLLLVLGLAGHRLRARAGDGGPLFREVEEAAGLRAGELEGARELRAAPDGASAPLAARQRRRVAAALAGRSDDDLLPLRLPAARARLRRYVGLGGLALALLAGTGLVRPADARAAVDALARPWRVAFPPRPPRLRLESAPTVLRGAPLEIRVIAPGRAVVTLAWAEEGEPVRRAGVAVDAGSGLAEGRTGPIDAPVRVWAEEEGGRASDTLRVTPVDPLLVTRLHVVVEPPAWTGFPADTLSGSASPVLVHAGSVVRVSGETNHPLASGRLSRGADAGEPIGEDDETALDVDGARFGATLRPARGGVWRFELRPAGAVPGVRRPPPLELRILEDRSPEVRILRPGRDLEAGIEAELPILVDATDDGGVVRVDLVTWRSSAAGLRSGPERRALATGGAESRRLVAASIPIAELGLVPGDTFHYRAEARDGNPRNPPGRSRDWRIWVAEPADLRRDATARVEALASGAAGAAEEARALSREAREAERLAAGDTRAAGGTEGMDRTDFRSTEAARAVRDRGADVERRLASLEDELRRLEKGLDGSPVAEPSLRARLSELASLFRELRESGLGERLRALEQAVAGLEREATREALAELAEVASELDRRIDEAAELIERAAAEQAARDASARAAELAAEQERAAEGVEPTPDWAEGEEGLARDAEDLAARMEALSERLEASGAERQADEFSAAETAVREAARSMREAAARARRDPPDAGEGFASTRAGAAASALRDAARRADEAARSLSRDWRDEAIGALDGAARQSLDLAAEQARLTRELESGREGRDLAGRQAAVRAGLERVTQALSEASRRSALVDSRVGPAAERARREMQRLERVLADDGGSPGGAAQSRALAERLNDLAGRLLASRREMEGAASGTGLEEALERLARLGRAQAGVNREAGGLLLPSLRGEVDAGRLARLARMQEEIARELESLAAGPGVGELPARPEALAAEADEIARSILDAGLDRGTVARQERLFRRLLDAGRTLERDPDRTRRESRTGVRVESAEPGAPAAEPPGGPRYPYPEDARLRGMSGEVRRLVLDYFDRLNRSFGEGS
ncbi:MAG: hypothetical protein R6X22_08675 [Gemmatimonadota bacterium]